MIRGQQGLLGRADTMAFRSMSLLVFTLLWVSSKGQTLYVALEKYETCPGTENLPDSFTEIRVQKISRHLNVANGVLNVTKRSRTLTGILTVYRCRDRYGEQCEYFLKVPVADMCYKYVEKGQFWSTLFGAYQPPHKCPIEKRIYRLVNGTYDSTKLVKYAKNIPGFTDFSWKMKTEIFDEDKLPYHCSAFVLRPYKTRNRRSLPTKISELSKRFYYQNSSSS